MFRYKEVYFGAATKTSIAGRVGGECVLSYK